MFICFQPVFAQNGHHVRLQIVYCTLRLEPSAARCCFGGGFEGDDGGIAYRIAPARLAFA